MLRAKDELNNEYLSYKFENEHIEFIKEKNLFCPNCQNKVLFVNAIKKIKHFRHFNAEECGGEPETEEHINMKLAMVKFLSQDKKISQIITEKRIGDQIADVYFKYNNQLDCAIECQCSPISEEDFKERNKKYHKKRIYKMWIFGNDFYNFDEEKESYRLKKIILENYGNIFYTVINGRIKKVIIKSTGRWIENEWTGFEGYIPYKVFKELGWEDVTNKKIKVFGDLTENLTI